MPTNEQVVETLREIADLLDLLGERFKPEAYRRAGRSIESLAESVEAVARRDQLRSIPGVGEAIEEKIREYLASGSIPYLERLRKEVPAGLIDLMRRPGLGPKTARRFWVELGIEGPTELRAAIEAGRLRGVKGFGERKIEQIRSALGAEAPAAGGARFPIETVYPLARRIVETLRSGSPAHDVAIAGSFRRARETVGDLDILVTSDEPARVFEVFSALPEIGEVRMRGGTKETVVLKNGLQVDVRVVEPSEFGAALLYFTGSKDHNVRLRTLAREVGLKINEYGIFRGSERVGGATEEEVYAALGLSWVPPELREDRGEVEAARAGTVPRLVEPAELIGDLHLHLPDDPSVRDAERLRERARGRKLRYAAVIVGGVHPDGSTWTVSEEVRNALIAPGNGAPRAIAAFEVGPGPVPAALSRIRFEQMVVRPAGGTAREPTFPPTAPARRLIAHVGGPPQSVRPWIELARTAGSALEIGPGPERIDSTAGRSAREAGVPLAVPTGVLEPDDSPTGVVALGFARRAGARAQDVANARDDGAATSAAKRSRR